MPARRSLGALSGIGTGIGDVGRMLLQRSLGDEDLQKRQTNDRLNQLINDFDTAARTISTPEHVEKVGADVARTEYANLKRRLPAGVTPLLGADPDFDSLDSTPSDRLGGLTKEVGAITDPDSAELTPGGLKQRAGTLRVPTAIPAMGAGPKVGVPAWDDASGFTYQNPEFEGLLKDVQSQKAGLLAKEPTEEEKNPLTGQSTFTTARQRNQPGFSAKTGLTPAEEASKQGGITAATEQATTDVKNLPANQSGAARGAGLISGAQKRAELAAEMASMGITGQQQTGALQLADDFEKSSAPFFTARTALQNASDLAKLGTPQGDIGLIYNVMSSYPGSGNVHQDEYVNAQNAASWPERVRQKWNSLVDGEKLTPAERQGFIDSLKTTYLAAKKDQDDRVKLFTDRATQLRVPARMVVREPSPVDTTLGSGDLLQSPWDRAHAAAGKTTPKPTVGVD